MCICTLNFWIKTQLRTERLISSCELRVSLIPDPVKHCFQTQFTQASNDTFVKNTDLLSAVYIIIVPQGSFGKLIRPHGKIESYKLIKSILKVIKFFSSQISEEWENYHCLALKKKKVQFHARKKKSLTTKQADGTTKQEQWLCLLIQWLSILIKIFNVAAHHQVLVQKTALVTAES